MTTFEEYIDITKKRKEYEENIEVIEKLKSKILDDYDVTPIELIKESIDVVQKQQKNILKELGVNSLSELKEKEKSAISNVEFKNMRKNIYSSMKNSFTKYEKNKKKNELEESLKQELEETKMDARDILIKTKKAIRKLENRIDEEDVLETKFLVKELEESLNSNDILEIKNKMNRLKEKDGQLAEKFYERFNVKEEIDENDIIDYEDEIVEVEENTDDSKTEVLTSDMKPNRDDDKTDVLTSDMKVQVTDEAQKREMYKDARVVFDGKYKLYFNNDSEVYESEVDEETLKHNCNINGIYDFNIITMLKEFDRKNSTNLYERYRDNKLPVDYDYGKSEKNKTKKSILKRLKAITDKEKNDKEFKNVTVKNSQKKGFRAAAIAVGLAAVTLLGSFGYNLKKNSTANGVMKPVEYTNDSQDDAGVTDAYYEEVKVNVNDSSMINDSFEDVELVDNDEVVEEVKEELVVEEKDKVRETRVGDIITFTDDVDLYYASTDLSPRGNTSYITEKTGKVGLISVVYDGNVVAYVDDNSKSLEEIKEECIAEYGDDIIVSVNLDSLNDNEEMVTQYLGWVDNEDFQNNTRELIK